MTALHYELRQEPPDAATYDDAWWAIARILKNRDRNNETPGMKVAYAQLVAAWEAISLLRDEHES